MNHVKKCLLNFGAALFAIQGISSAAFADSVRKALDTQEIEVSINDFRSDDTTERFIGSAATQGILRNREFILTFDDGPNQNTVAVLDILKKYNVKAVFFMVGQKLIDETASRKAKKIVVLPQAKKIVHRILDEGHQIANHSKTHPGFKSLLKNEGLGAVMEEIRSTHQALYAAADRPGDHVEPFFRFPGGTFNVDLIRIIDQINLINWHWDIDSFDYVRQDEVLKAQKVLNDPRKSEAEKQQAQATVQTAPGKIVDRVLTLAERKGKGTILFHDIHPLTGRVLPEILEGLIAQDARFVLLKVKEDSLRTRHPLGR